MSTMDNTGLFSMEMAVIGRKELQVAGLEVKLARTQEELKAARLRITELEAQLSELGNAPDS